MNASTRSARRLWLPLVLSLSAMSLLAIPIALSRWDIMLAAGSDALTLIARPPLWAQVLAVLALGVALYLVLVLPWRRGGGASLAALLVAVCAYAMSVHSIILDGKSSSIRDNWLGMDVQGLAFDPVEGLGADTRYSRSRYWLELHRGPRRLRLFLGAGPWRLPVEGILSLTRG